MLRRLRGKGRIRYYRRDELEPYGDYAHDDAEETDHLARLANGDVLARVIVLELEGERYGTST